jgi:hypothetical protein
MVEVTMWEERSREKCGQKTIYMAVGSTLISSKPHPYLGQNEVF